MAYLIHQTNEFVVSTIREVKTYPILEHMMVFGMENYTSFKDKDAYRDDFIQKVKTSSADGKFTDEELLKLLGAKEGDKLACTIVSGPAYIPEGEHIYLVFLEQEPERPNIANYNYKRHIHFWSPESKTDAEFDDCVIDCGTNENNNAFVQTLLNAFDGCEVFQSDSMCKIPLMCDRDGKIVELLPSKNCIFLERNEYDGRYNIRSDKFDELFEEYKKINGYKYE